MPENLRNAELAEHGAVSRRGPGSGRAAPAPARYYMSGEDLSTFFPPPLMPDRGLRSLTVVFLRRTDFDELAERAFFFM